MKKILILLVLVSVVLLGGCRGKKGNTGNAGNLESTTKDGSPVFPQEYSLTGRIHDAELYLQYPKIAYVADSLIVVVSSGKNIQGNIGGVYNVRDDMKKVASFGYIGRGPDEFLSTMLTSVSGNQFVIYDEGYKSVSIMEITDGGEDEVEVVRKTRYELTNWGRGETMGIKNITRVSDKYYVAVAGKGKEEYFALIGDTLNVIKYFGEAPLKNEMSENARQVSVMTDHYLAAGDGLFVYSSSYYTRSITCYKLNGDKMEKAWEDQYGPASYKLDKNGSPVFEKSTTIIGCMGAYMTEKYVYLIVNFDTLASMKDPDLRNDDNRKILVYDHDGNRIAQIHLDHLVGEFAVSSDDKKLYGYLHSEDKFISYDLPF